MNKPQAASRKPQAAKVASSRPLATFLATAFSSLALAITIVALTPAQAVAEDEGSAYCWMNAPFCQVVDSDYYFYNCHPQPSDNHRLILSWLAMSVCDGPKTD